DHEPTGEPLVAYDVIRQRPRPDHFPYPVSRRYFRDSVRSGRTPAGDLDQRRRAPLTAVGASSGGGVLQKRDEDASQLGDRRYDQYEAAGNGDDHAVRRGLRTRFV